MAFFGCTDEDEESFFFKKKSRLGFLRESLFDLFGPFVLLCMWVVCFSGKEMPSKMDAQSEKNRRKVERKSLKDVSCGQGKRKKTLGCSWIHIL